MLNLAMLAALNRGPELKLHINGALNNGLTKEEIKEIFLQVAIYCGIPASLDAFKTASGVFKDRGHLSSRHVAPAHGAVRRQALTALCVALEGALGLRRRVHATLSAGVAHRERRQTSPRAACWSRPTATGQTVGVVSVGRDGDDAELGADVRRSAGHGTAARDGRCSTRPPRWRAGWAAVRMTDPRRSPTPHRSTSAWARASLRNAPSDAIPGRIAAVL